MLGFTAWNLTALLIRMYVAANNEDSTKTLLDPSSYSYRCDPPIPPPRGCIGAVYFTTNDKLGNWVVINCIQPNGTLLFNNTISTFGRGNGDSPYLTSLLLDNVVTGDNFLFVANSGSDSVSIFTIDPLSPEKLSYMTRINSQGNFPACLAYSSTLKILCVLNAGLINNVACFKVSSKTGLTPLPNTIKPIGKSHSDPPALDDTVSDIKFTSDSSQLIVTVKGGELNKLPGVLAVFQVLSQGTVLSDPVLNTVQPSTLVELTLIPTTIENCNNNNGQNMIYSSEPGYTGTVPSGLALFVVPSSGIIHTGSIVYVPIPWNTIAGWSKFSSRTGNLYTTDRNVLTETRIECSKDGRLSGTVLKQHTFDSSLGEFAFVSIPSGEYMYATVEDYGSLDIIDAFNMSTKPTLIQTYAPDNATIVAQTGQPLRYYHKGIAAFIAQPQGGGGHDPPCG